MIFIIFPVLYSCLSILIPSPVADLLLSLLILSPNSQETKQILANTMLSTPLKTPTALTQHNSITKCQLSILRNTFYQGLPVATLVKSQKNSLPGHTQPLYLPKNTERAVIIKEK